MHPEDKCWRHLDLLSVVGCCGFEHRGQNPEPSLHGFAQGWRQAVRSPAPSRTPSSASVIARLLKASDGCRRGRAAGDVACRVDLRARRASTARRRRMCRAIAKTVLAPPDFGVRRELRLRRERTAQFSVVAFQMEAGAKRSPYGFRDLAKPVAERGPNVRRCRITTSNRLEVLRGAAGHVEHVGSWCPKLEGAALVIVDVVAKVAHQIDWHAGQACGL